MQARTIHCIFNAVAAACAPAGRSLARALRRRSYKREADLRRLAPAVGQQLARHRWRRIFLRSRGTTSTQVFRRPTPTSCRSILPSQMNSERRFKRLRITTPERFLNTPQWGKRLTDCQVCQISKSSARQLKRSSTDLSYRAGKRADRSDWSIGRWN